MIFPTHCRFIGSINKYKRPDYKPEDIIYFSSQYMLVFEAPDRCEVYEVKSSGDGTFLKTKTAVSMIAGADNTLVYATLVDISNRANLVKRASQVCKGNINTVVFKGIDQHMTFVHEPSMEGFTTIEVHDIAPPEPAWLAYNVQRLEEAGLFGEHTLNFEYHVLNLKDFEDQKKTVIFPCYASGLNGLFLDCLDGEPRGDIKLVGCSTSKQVFEARYPLKRYEHVNICPLANVKPSNPFILRCCQSDKLGLKEINGIPGVVVHWGANPREIYEALKLLMNTIQN